MELPRRRMYGYEEEDAMTLFRAGAGAGRSMSSMYHHDIAAGELADDVLNLYGNGTAAVSSATERHHLCHEHHQQARSSRRSSHVDVATYDDDDEIEQAVALRRRRRRQQQQQGVADDDAATDAVLVAWDNQEAARQNAEAAERNAEAARDHAEVAMASAVPRVVAEGGGVAAEVAARPPRRRRQDAEAAQRDNDTAAAEAAARAHAQIAHLIADGVAEVAGLRAEMAWSSDVAAAGIIMSFAAALFVPFLMAALLYYILPLTLKYSC